MDRHGHRHGHRLPRRLPREDPRAEVGVSDARGSRPAAARVAPFSSPTCPRTFVRRALFLLARMSVGDARVYTCTCTVHDKLLCTRLQNCTIGASLNSVSVLVSMSVPWNLSYKVPLAHSTNFISKSLLWSLVAKTFLVTLFCAL